MPNHSLAHFLFIQQISTEHVSDIANPDMTKRSSTWTRELIPGECNEVCGRDGNRQGNRKGEWAPGLEPGGLPV